MQQLEDTRINDNMVKYLFAFVVKDPQGKSMSAGSSISSLWRKYSQMLLLCSHSTQMNSIQLHLDEGCHVLLVERGAREGEALEGAQAEDVAGGLHVDDL